MGISYGFLEHQPREGGGNSTAVCEDSGDGFDFAEYSDTVMQQQSASTGRYAGRGLEILRRMTRNLKVHGRGNRVVTVYDVSRRGHNQWRLSADKRG